MTIGPSAPASLIEAAEAASGLNIVGDAALVLVILALLKVLERLLARLLPERFNGHGTPAAQAPALVALERAVLAAEKSRAALERKLDAQGKTLDSVLRYCEQADARQTNVDLLRELISNMKTKEN